MTFNVGDQVREIDPGDEEDLGIGTVVSALAGVWIEVIFGADPEVYCFTANELKKLAMKSDPTWEDLWAVGSI